LKSFIADVRAQASPRMSVSVGAVAGEVEGFVFEDGDEVGEAVNHSVLNQARANWSLCRWMAMGAQGGRLYVADVFDEEEDEDVVFVPGGVHAAGDFVAGGFGIRRLG
jgi:hypothetical protein